MTDSTEISFSFNMDEIGLAITSAICNAVEEIMPDIMVDNALQERNGYGQFRWNAIISQLRSKCHQLGWIDLETCPRGGWKVPVLFHPATTNIFTLMTEDTFSSTQRRKDKGKHYLCGAGSFNQGLELKSEQLAMDLPIVPSCQELWVVSSRQQLADSIHADVGEINGHILVLFSVVGDKLIQVRAVRVTSNLEISTEEESWTKYIRATETQNKKTTPQQNGDEDEEMFVETI